ncbi:MAG: tetratricopeptide repeat protein [Ignavibacteria bacterium]|jgi:tetratricopeptide (TPR) repeat protein
MSTIKYIKCANCGDENKLDTDICLTCGSKLEGDNIFEKTEGITEQRISDENLAPKVKPVDKKESKNKAVHKNKKQAKVLSKVKLVYFVFSLLILSGLVLVSSGTFNEPEAFAASNHSTESNQNDPHKGVDLNSLNRIAQLEKDLTTNPNDYEKTIELAHLLNDSGFYEKAVQYYNKYLMQLPDNADVLVDLGVCYFEMNDFNNAIDKMEKAVKINPAHQIAHFNLGIVNYSANNVADAKDWWRKTINLNPGSDIAKKAQELIDNN